MSDTKTTMPIDFNTIVPKFDKILERGLCEGVGTRDGQMCIEAAVCAALDLPHGDNPACVSSAVRSFKIALNDSTWSSPEARAKGLRALGIAQLGSKGVISDSQFVSRLTEKIIRELLPSTFRTVAAVFEEPHKTKLMEAGDRCAAEGTEAAARAGAARAAWAAAEAAEAAWAARAARAAAEAAWAARAAKTPQSAPDPDFYLKLAADIALQVLIDLKSPGALWLLESQK